MKIYILSTAKLTIKIIAFQENLKAFLYIKILFFYTKNKKIHGKYCSVSVNVISLLRPLAK